MLCFCAAAVLMQIEFYRACSEDMRSVFQSMAHMLWFAGHVQYVVLDEADKMLSLGLHPQLKRIRALVIPKKRKPGQEEAGVLAKPHTRQKRPQVCTNLWIGQVRLL